MSREKEVFDAIKTLQQAIIDKIIIPGDHVWGEIKHVTGLYIDRRGGFNTYHSTDWENTGMHVNDNQKLKVRDISAALEEERNKAQKEYDRALQEVKTNQKTLEDARKKLENIDNKIVGTK